MRRLTDPIPDTICIFLKKDEAYKLSSALHNIISLDDGDEKISLEDFNSISNFSHILTRNLTIGD